MSSDITTGHVVHFVEEIVARWRVLLAYKEYRACQRQPQPRPPFE